MWETEIICYVSWEVPYCLKKTCLNVSCLLFLQSRLKAFSATIKNIEVKYISASEVAEKIDLMAENQENEGRKLSGYKNIITDFRFRRRWPVTKSEYLQTEFVLWHFSGVHGKMGIPFSISEALIIFGIFSEQPEVCCWDW